MREVGCPGDADLGIGGDQILLRGADIGTALQQGGRQAGGNVRGQVLLGEAAPARHAAGVLPEQEADLILGLFDLLLDGRGWSRAAV